jgi:hypothetical protein
MAKLKVELGRYDRFVLGRILEQPEGFRGKRGEKEKLFTATNGFKLLSYSNPAVGQNELWLRGCETALDGMHFSHECADASAAEVMLDQLQEAIRQFNEEYKDKPQAIPGAVIKLIIAE